jgi:hypothetical protein
MPCSGCAVPQTGVRNLCSVDLSRTARGCCRSGKSQCAPVSCITSFGNDGRSAGFRSTPHPGSSCGARRCFARYVVSHVYKPQVAPSMRCRDDQRLDAAIQLVGHEVIPFGDLVQRNAMGHDGGRLQDAVADVLEQSRPLPLDGALIAVSSAHAACTATAITSTRTRARSAESMATHTRAAATTAGRPNSCACPSPTSVRARFRSGWKRKTPSC